jgi:hypothetical protein
MPVRHIQGHSCCHLCTFSNYIKESVCVRPSDILLAGTQSDILLAGKLRVMGITQCQEKSLSVMGITPCQEKSLSVMGITQCLVCLRKTGSLSAMGKLLGGL